MVALKYYIIILSSLRLATAGEEYDKIKIIHKGVDLSKLLLSCIQSFLLVALAKFLVNNFYSKAIEFGNIYLSLSYLAIFNLSLFILSRMQINIIKVRQFRIIALTTMLGGLFLSMLLFALSE